MDHVGADDEGRADAIPSRVQHTPATLTVSELRTAVQQHLRRSGALHSLKTQLRGMMLQGIMQAQGGQLSVRPRSSSSRPSANLLCSLPQTSSSAQPPHAAAACTAQNDSTPTRSAWARHIADALVVNHLRRIGCVMSLALFSTEAEVLSLSDTGSPAAEEAYLQQLLFASASHRQRRTSSGLDEMDTAASADVENERVTAMGTPRRGKDACHHSASPRDASAVPQHSVLLYMVEQHMRQAMWTTAEPMQHCGTQTPPCSSQHDAARSPRSSLVLPGEPAGQRDGCGGGGGGSHMSLECKLAAVNAQYALRWSHHGQASHDLDDHMNHSHFFMRHAVERRLQQYKEDMHQQLREEYAQKYATLEQTRLQEVRDAAEARWKVFVQTKQEELTECERSLRERVERERAQLREERLALAAQRERLDRQRREMQEQLRSQEEAMNGQLSTQRELYDKLHTAQLQASQWEELATARLLEVEAARERVARGVREHRRLGEAHVTELAMREEQIHVLRQRIRSLLAGQVQGETGSPLTHHITRWHMDETDCPPHDGAVKAQTTRPLRGYGEELVETRPPQRPGELHTRGRDSHSLVSGGAPYSRGGNSMGNEVVSQTLSHDTNESTVGRQGRMGDLAEEGRETSSVRASDIRPIHREEAERDRQGDAGDTMTMPWQTMSSSRDGKATTMSSPFPHFEPRSRLATAEWRTTEEKERAGAVMSAEHSHSSVGAQSSASASQSVHTDTNEEIKREEKEDVSSRPHDEDKSNRDANSSSTATTPIRDCSTHSSSRSSRNTSRDNAEDDEDTNRRTAAVVGSAPGIHTNTHNDVESRESSVSVDVTSADVAATPSEVAEEEETQRAQRRSLMSDEEMERAELVSSADADRRGIEWIATSQRTAIVTAEKAAQQQKERQQQSSNAMSGGGDDVFFAALAAGDRPLVGGGGGGSGTLGHANTTRTDRQHREVNETDDNIFFDEPSGDDDDDILFGRGSKQSSDSSF